MAQLVKYLPASRETQVWSLGWEDPWEGNGNPHQYSCLGNPMGRGAWWAAVHKVAKSRKLSYFTFTFHFHSLEKEMATHSSVLAWRIPGTVEPGGLPSMGSYRVGHNWSDLAAAAELAQTHVHQASDAIQSSHPLLSASPPTFNLFQHHGLFQWVSSSHQVAKALEFQLQHQSFQWTPRTDLF